jgi:NAD(P)-dependent dehydrogenase (short-subunit alcohol dehydrogenase family)
MALSGKTIIVTGGARGIGDGITRHLARLGAHIIIADQVLDPAGTEHLRAQGLKVTSYEVDVTDPAQVDRLMAFAADQPEVLHALINNAGIYSNLKPTPFEELTAEQFTQILAVNVTGVFNCCKAVLPWLRDCGAGRIVNIASAVAFKGNPLMAHYVASKGAVISLTRALAREVGSQGILVNCVAPGFTLTDVVKKNEALVAGVKHSSLQTRVIKKDMLASDVAGAVSFFCLPASGFVTGQTLVVDGGAYFH